jgi:hypothetical protein
VIGTFAAVALGTTPVSFTSLAVVTANLDNSVQLNSDRVKFQTKDPTFVRVAKITIAEGGNSGWHHHPGMVIVAVLSGTVKFTNSDCSSTTHVAGTAFVEGGAPTTPARDAAWRTCTAAQADELCRDRFRLVLEQDAVTLSVNGVPYMEHRGLPQAARLPDELLRSSVYVYFASWTYLGEPAVVRFHWGRIAINP